MKDIARDVWYVGNTGNHQGLVIHEKTGESIAVVYDKKNAALLASAPELLSALSAAVDLMASPYVSTDALSHTNKINYTNAIRAAKLAIERAKG